MLKIAPIFLSGGQLLSLSHVIHAALVCFRGVGVLSLPVIPHVGSTVELLAFTEVQAVEAESVPWPSQRTGIEKWRLGHGII